MALRLSKYGRVSQISQIKKCIKYRRVKTGVTGYIHNHYIIISSEGAYFSLISYLDKACKHIIFIMNKQGLDMFGLNFKFLKK